MGAMRRMTTNDDEPAGLSEQQERAIGLLLAGKSVTETADTLGLARQTVSAWRNQDERFVLALNQRRRALWEDYHDRLRRLVGAALDVLAEALADKRDPDAALALLKLYAGHVRLDQTGPATAAEWAQAQHDRAQAEFAASVGILGRPGG